MLGGVGVLLGPVEAILIILIENIIRDRVGIGMGGGGRK
jgi:hypothetical protein